MSCSQTVPSSVWRLNVDSPPTESLMMGAVGDERWWDQIDLVKLILAVNQLTELSEDIRLLPSLVSLDVSEGFACSTF